MITEEFGGENLFRARSPSQEITIKTLTHAKPQSASVENLHVILNTHTYSICLSEPLKSVTKPYMGLHRTTFNIVFSHSPLVLSLSTPIMHLHSALVSRPDVHLQRSCPRFIPTLINISSRAQLNIAVLSRSLTTDVWFQPPESLKMKEKKSTSLNTYWCDNI